MNNILPSFYSFRRWSLSPEFLRIIKYKQAVEIYDGAMIVLFGVAGSSITEFGCSSYPMEVLTFCYILLVD